MENKDLPISIASELLTKTDNLLGGIIEVRDHLKILNGQVAKHNEWIARYDIRVADEFPKLQTEFGKIKLQLAFWGGGIAIITVLADYFFRFVTK